MLFETVNETATEEIVFDCLKILKSEPIKEQIKRFELKFEKKSQRVKTL